MIRLSKGKENVYISAGAQSWRIASKRRAYFNHSPRLLRVMQRLRSRGYQDFSEQTLPKKTSLEFTVYSN